MLSLGRRPRNQWTKKVPALKVRFSFGAGLIIISAVFQSLSKAILHVVFSTKDCGAGPFKRNTGNCCAGTGSSSTNGMSGIKPRTLNRAFSARRFVFTYPWGVAPG
jgi:hypothetical protein